MLLLLLSLLQQQHRSLLFYDNCWPLNNRVIPAQTAGNKVVIVVRW